MEGKKRTLFSLGGCVCDFCWVYFFYQRTTLFLSLSSISLCVPLFPYLFLFFCCTLPPSPTQTKKEKEKEKRKQTKKEREKEKRKQGTTTSLLTDPFDETKKEELIGHTRWINE